MKASLWFLLGGIFASVLIATTAHCATSSHSHNSYGAVIYQENPNQYIEGAITNGEIAKYNNKLYTVVRVQPFHTYSIFSQDIAFCGNVAEMFNGMTGPVVITYSRVMHQRDCFDLYGVHKVAEKKLP